MSDRIEPAVMLDMTIVSQLVADLDPATAVNLVTTFVDEMIARTGRIAQAAADGDSLALQHEAHALKSSAGTYGACQVAEAAQEVEALCRGGDLAATIRVAQTLPRLARQAAEAFATWQAGLD